jgi:hypothetical protein
MSESNKEFDPRNQSVDAAIAKGDEKERYVQAALENLRATSRTATGVVDTSASVGKAEKMASGLTPEQTAERALNNFTEAISYLYENKDRQFNESGELRVFVETVAQKINTGITKEGVLLRAEDSDKFPYTRIQDLESAMEQFYQELLERLSRPDADPKEIAAFVEYRIGKFVGIFSTKQYTFFGNTSINFLSNCFYKNTQFPRLIKLSIFILIQVANRFCKIIQSSFGCLFRS